MTAPTSDQITEAMRRLRPGAGYTLSDTVVVMDDGSPPPSFAEFTEVLDLDPIPASVTRFQARAALLSAGLLDDVDAAVAVADRFVQIAWADAQAFERSSPTIAALSTALGLTDTELDDLFRAAAKISA